MALLQFLYVPGPMCILIDMCNGSKFKQGFRTVIKQGEWLRKSKIRKRLLIGRGNTNRFRPIEKGLCGNTPWQDQPSMGKFILDLTNNPWSQPREEAI